MKKLVCLVISAVILLSVFICSANASMVIKVGEESFSADKGDTLVYTCELENEELILCGEVQVLYPAELLKIAEAATYNVKSPIKNTDIPGEVNVNFSTPKGHDFTERKSFLVLKFDVIENGEGEIKYDPQIFYNMDYKVITGDVKYYESVEIIKAETNPDTEPVTETAVETTAELTVETTSEPVSEAAPDEPVYTSAPDETTLPEETATEAVETTSAAVEETTSANTESVTTEPTETVSETPVEETTESEIKKLRDSLMYQIADASMGIIEGVEYRGDQYLYYDEFEKAYKEAYQLWEDDNASAAQLEQALNKLTEARNKLVPVESMTITVELTTSNIEETTVPVSTSATEPSETTTPVTEPAEKVEAPAPKKLIDKAVKSGTKDLKGSSFTRLKARVSKATKNSVTLKWSKKAKTYLIYGGKALKKAKYLGATSKTSFKIKKLKKNTAYKFFVVACSQNNTKSGIEYISKNIFISTKGSKFNYVKSVKASPKTIKLKVKKTKKIKAKEILKYKNRKLKRYRKLSYECSNIIASVTSKGKIKAKKKGTGYIYIYSQNGTYAKVKIQVK